MKKFFRLAYSYVSAGVLFIGLYAAFLDLPNLPHQAIRFVLVYGVMLPLTVGAALLPIIVFWYFLGAVEFLGKFAANFAIWVESLGSSIPPSFEDISHEPLPLRLPWYFHLFWGTSFAAFVFTATLVEIKPEISDSFPAFFKEIFEAVAESVENFSGANDENEPL